MTNKNSKREKNWTLAKFFAQIFGLIKLIYLSIKTKLSLRANKTKNFYINIKKTTSFNFIIKQIILFFILFYYIFQIIAPKGFIYKLTKYVYRYRKLHIEIQDLTRRQLYINNTLRAISENKTDTIEEFMITHTGKQYNNARKFLYLTE